MTADNWSHEETGDPLYADRRTELLILAQQRGQLRNVRRDPAGFVPGQQSRCGSSPRLRLEVDIRQSLAVAVADDVAASVVLFDVPGRREVATLDHHRHLGRSAQPPQGREVEQGWAVPQ